MYEINMDLYQYGLSRDESVCVYTNAAFLAAADSKRFVLFNVRNGKFVGILQIPTHLERNKGTQDLFLLILIAKGIVSRDEYFFKGLKIKSVLFADGI
jgi:hypothetical protein